MTATTFIVAFRPHQRAAWAETFGSEESFCSDWENGCFARSCNAEPSGDDEISFAAAWENAGHDLHSLTRLDSADEVRRYLAERDYAGRHNKAMTAVRRCAEELGWLQAETDAE